MKTLFFNYTKADGKTSARVLVPSVTPSKFYAGTDISELSTEDQALYITEIEKAKEAYLNAIIAINNKYDLNNRYRQFDPAKMSDVKTEEI